MQVRKALHHASKESRLECKEGKQASKAACLNVGKDTYSQAPKVTSKPHPCKQASMHIFKQAQKVYSERINKSLLWCADSDTDYDAEPIAIATEESDIDADDAPAGKCANVQQTARQHKPIIGSASGKAVILGGKQHKHRGKQASKSGTCLKAAMLLQVPTKRKKVKSCLLLAGAQVVPASTHLHRRQPLQCELHARRTPQRCGSCPLAL